VEEIAAQNVARYAYRNGTPDLYSASPILDGPVVIENIMKVSPIVARRTPTLRPTRRPTWETPTSPTVIKFTNPGGWLVSAWMIVTPRMSGVNNTKTLQYSSVEQGPTLEETGRDVGVVEIITSISHSQVAVTGEANHAGTTSMALRQDAFMGAAEFALALESAARGRATETAAIGTVGKVEARPNGTNVVPEDVTLGVDTRDTDEQSRRTLINGMRERGGEIADDRDLGFEWEDLLDVSATPMDEEVVETLDDACGTVGIESTRMPSGAGHDAMNVARATPTGMLFIPSEDGISHSPVEYTPPKNLANGARVLERGLRSLASV